MQSQLQSSFQRVEQALQRLTDSIAAYNPSVSAAEELQVADEDVSQDLRKLVIHQRNYLRKEELRRQTDAYDNDIKNKIRQLSETRKELLGISAYNAADEPVREIDVDELLRYAKFISKTTVPPTLRKHEAKPQEVKKEDVSAQLANGTATPPAEVEGQNGTEGKVGDEVAGMKAIDGENKAWLGQSLPFDPWPSHFIIQRGALGEIQRMVEGGQDPASVLSAEEKAEAERRKAEEEEREKLEQAEAQRRRASLYDTGGAMRRRGTVEAFNPDEM